MDNNNQIIIYQTDDDQTQIDVRLENETVWLTTHQMAMLFDREESNIRRHVINVFKEGELEKENNVHFLHVNGVKTVATAQVALGTGHRVKTGTVATMTMTACRDLIRMRIMISNAFKHRTQFLLSFLSRISLQFSRDIISCSEGFYLRISKIFCTFAVKIIYNMTLHEYIEQQILPRYAAFDKGHQRDHAESVIQESLVLAKEHGADLDMAYTIAAFHDLGLGVNRELHHIHSGEILMADPVLPEFFTDEQRCTMRAAVEDHRASSKHAPRTIYGAIVAEADRHIDPETILRRALQFGMKQHPDADFEWHFNRAYEHMLEKYAEGGYMRLWLNSKRNVEGLTRLREIIDDKEQMREICERLWRTV